MQGLTPSGARADSSEGASATGRTRGWYVPYVFAFALLGVTFTPSRTLAQLLPFLVVPVVLYVHYRRSLAGVAALWMPFLAIFLLSVVSAFYNASSVYNWSLATVTWFGGIVALLIGYKLGHALDLRTYLKGLFLLSVAQVPVGLYQMFSFVGFRVLNPFELLASVGDQFGGTLLLAGVNSHVVGLKLAMTAIIAYLTLRFVYRSRGVQAGVLGLLVFGWIMPSAIHSFLAFLLAAITATIWMRKFRMGFRVVALAALLMVGVVTTQDFAVRYVRDLASRALTLSAATSPKKVVALYRTVVELPEVSEAAPVLGVGLGRYSSYAALILTGEFLSDQPGYLPINASQETRRFILPYWNRRLLARDVWAHGVANQPFFTYMSIYAELGLLGLACFVGFWIVVLRDLHRFYRTSSEPLLARLALGLFLFTLFLAYLFFFDNWFEDARLMVPYFLTLGILYRKQAMRGEVRTLAFLKLLARKPESSAGARPEGAVAGAGD